VEEESTQKLVDWSSSERAARSGNRKGRSLVTKVASGGSDPVCHNMSKARAGLDVRPEKARPPCGKQTHLATFAPAPLQMEDGRLDQN
jgi:hypothetical protein